MISLRILIMFGICSEEFKLPTRQKQLNFDDSLKLHGAFQTSENQKTTIAITKTTTEKGKKNSFDDFHLSLYIKFI